MTRTSNSSPDDTRATREETEDCEELVSSTSEGRCLAEVNDGDGPMDDAEKYPPVDVEGGASTSSASAGLCLADDDDGPINIAEISATLEQQDRAEKAEAQRINSQTSSAAIPPPRRESSGSSFSPSLRESSASLVQISLAETNLAVSAQELTIPPTDGDGRDTSAQRALSMESAGVASVPSSIMAEAYTVPDTPVFTASIVEVMPW
ncbi:hypothetical protein THAOC_24716 [Thalassiosira oceanica]|uniref:DUF6742 domain-containing protein n=1 Tax=Thalassiosira oceanica TaxID=159749 RepID=K0S3J2_THAOC|nr:hypothetical protein THAOC_24716 [Thalassiosira oceanica]|eukprot:EJK55546.1 hypothetical protein THAOC_24716 [Thalassiosira oceanica]